MKIDPDAPASEMTIRLEIATRAMQGILASLSPPNYKGIAANNWRSYTMRYHALICIAEDAVSMANELIKWAEPG